MATLSQDIAAYERMRDRLEAEHHGRWAVVHDEELIDTYGSFERAADDAVRRFGRGPYLIREIGGRPPTLPASVQYRPLHAVTATLSISSPASFGSEAAAITARAG